MRWLALPLGIALVAGAGGCRNTCGPVERELAARECDVRTLKDELSRSEGLNLSLVRELQALRGGPGPHGERLPPAHPVKGISLGGMTGGRAGETLPGDDALQVMLEVRDHEDQPLKVPGALVVEAIEVTAEGLKRPLSVWQVTPEELRGKWQQGLFNTGYLLTFPWKAWPTADRLKVVARFTLPDGRAFEAEKTITVRVMPKMVPVLPMPTPVPETKPPALPPSMPKAEEGPTLTSAPARLLRPVPLKGR